MHTIHTINGTLVIGHNGSVTYKKGFKFDNQVCVVFEDRGIPGVIGPDINVAPGEILSAVLEHAMQQTQA